MPTMREDMESYQDRNIGDYKNYPEQDKTKAKQMAKIWEQIEKEAEDDDENNSSDGEDIPGPDEDSQGSESSESDEQKEPKESTESKEDSS